LGLRENLRQLLEFESGSNDPVAYIMTIMLLGVIGLGAEANWWVATGEFAMQMSIGAAAGYLLGRMAVWIINRINIPNASLYGIMLLAIILLIFSITDVLHGNGYLAVYLGGLVLSNNKLVYKKSMTNFMDGFMWLAQIVMFLALGLLVNPFDLFTFETTMIGLLVGVFMIVFARPAAVFLSLAPFRVFSLKARAYIGWVGLRGAVPIIFATYPLVAVADGFNPDVAALIFNVVFFITMLSLIIQGTTVSAMARVLCLSSKLPEDDFGIDLPDKIKSALSEIEVREAFLAKGEQLKHISLPDNTLVVMVKRGEEYFVPMGSSELKLGDKLLVISDNDVELKQELEQLGIESDRK
jgi:cell volume regulation protein A